MPELYQRVLEDKPIQTLSQDKEHAEHDNVYNMGVNIFLCNKNLQVKQIQKLL